MAIHYKMDVDGDRFITHHWTHNRTGDERELIVVTGVVLVHEKGEGDTRWKREQINLDINVPHAPSGKVFAAEHWAPFVTINAVGNANSGGYAVDAFRLVDPTTGRRFITLQADIAIRGKKAELYRIAYNVTLVGTFYTELI